MADNSVETSTGGSILSNPLFYVGCGIVLLGGAAYVWKKYGQPEIVEDTKTETTTTKTPAAPKQESPAVTKPTTTAAASPAASKPDTGKDYSSLPNSKKVYDTSPDSLNGLTLGDDVKIKSDAIITRMDKGLAEQGTTTLTSNTNLGKIWHLFPSSIIVRATGGFSYPFYKVAVSDVCKGFFCAEGGVVMNVMHVDNPLAGDYFRNRSGVESSIPVSGKLMTIPSDSINADGFAGGNSLSAEGRISLREASVKSAIRKLSDMYMTKPNESLGVWGFGEYWMQDKSGKPVFAGIKVMSTNSRAQEELPDTFEGFKLYFTQGGMPVPQKDYWGNGFKGQKTGDADIMSDYRNKN